MDASEIIATFCQKLGLDPGSGDEGAWSFEMDGMFITIYRLPEIGSLAITGELCEPPRGGLEKLYRTMLEAQYLFRETAGAAISLHPETGRFVLCRTMSCHGLEADDFFAGVERFISAMEAWTRIVRDYRGDVSEATSGETAALQTGAFLRV